MEIRTEIKDSICTIYVTGDIDTLTAGEVDTAIAEVVPECREKDLILVLDFANVEYISSSGLRTVVKARQQMGEGKFKLVNVGRNVADVFKMTRFTKIIDISEAE